MLRPSPRSGPAATHTSTTIPARQRTLLRAVAVGALSGALALGLAVPTTAGPAEQKRQVERKLDDAHDDYDASTTRLLRAAGALDRAEARLSRAKDRLAEVRKDLVVAKAKDATAARKLAEATAAEAAAKQAAQEAADAVDAQRSEIVQFANATYQNSDLNALSVVLGSRSTDDLLSAMQVVSSVSGSQEEALQRYSSSRTQLNVQLAASHQAQDVATAARKEAAARLADVRSLERRQKAQTHEVAELVSARAASKREAKAAKADAKRRIHALQREKHRLQKKLEELARKRAEQRKRERDRSDDAGSSSTPPSRDGSLFGRPVNGPITSPYGLRYHPILHYWRMHDGMDFGVACGTPLYAARSGRVVSSYYSSGYGNRVILDHGWLAGASFSTSYNHLTRYVVYAGQHVSAGQLIGYSGTTGMSTGCHLHFMVYRNGATVNPADYI